MEAITVCFVTLNDHEPNSDLPRPPSLMEFPRVSTNGARSPGLTAMIKKFTECREFDWFCSATKHALGLNAAHRDVKLAPDNARMRRDYVCINTPIITPEDGATWDTSTGGATFDDNQSGWSRLVRMAPPCGLCDYKFTHTCHNELIRYGMNSLSGNPWENTLR